MIHSPPWTAKIKQSLILQARNPMREPSHSRPETVAMKMTGYERGRCSNADNIVREGDMTEAPKKLNAIPDPSVPGAGGYLWLKKDGRGVVSAHDVATLSVFSFLASCSCSLRHSPW
jgi:hypothetical protein